MSRIARSQSGNKLSEHRVDKLSCLHMFRRRDEDAVNMASNFSVAKGWQMWGHMAPSTVKEIKHQLDSDYKSWCHTWWQPPRCHINHILITSSKQISFTLRPWPGSILLFPSLQQRHSSMLLLLPGSVTGMLFFMDSQTHQTTGVRHPNTNLFWPS